MVVKGKQQKCGGSGGGGKTIEMWWWWWWRENNRNDEIKTKSYDVIGVNLFLRKLMKFLCKKEA